MKTNQYIFSPRIIRSSRADCWGLELESSAKAYTDDFLRELADDGLNGIWVHVLLRETVPSRLFPHPNPRQLVLLNQLVQRAARFEVKVYTYLLEPRGFPANAPFWTKHPEAKGRLSCTSFCMCTSTPAVQEFIEESCHNLFKLTPGLGGAFCITASETTTHCYWSYAYKKRKQPLVEELARSDVWNESAIYKDPVGIVYKLKVTRTRRNSHEQIGKEKSRQVSEVVAGK